MSSPPPDLLGSLAQHRVWGLLSASVRQALVAQSQVLNLHTGDLVAAAGEWSAHLWLILQGRVDLKDPELAQTHTLLADESFGAGITPWNLQQSCHVSCTEDSQLLQVPKACLQDLLVSEPAITPFLPVPLDGRHPGSPFTARNPGTDTHLLGMRLQHLIKQPPITLPPQATVLEVTRIMRERGVSSVMLVEEGHLMGLVTDRDLRNRVVAEGLNLSRSVADIATLNPMSLDQRSPAFEALLLMARHNIHHVPVMDGQRIAGMVTATDLTQSVWA